MFRNIITKLSHKEKDLAENNNESVEILRLLKHKNSHLTVKVEGHQETFQSSIITINRLNNILTMDEFFPKPELKIRESSPLCCEFHENGTLTSFNATFIDNTHSNGMPAILVSLPSTIKQDQRRNNFRLTLKPGQIPSAKLTPSYRPALTGIIKDISNHGLRINIQGNENDSLKKGDILKSCHLNLEKDKVVECQLTVRNKRYYSRPYRHTQIGTEITDIQISDRNLLNQYVNQQQRSQCKLRAIDRL